MFPEGHGQLHDLAFDEFDSLARVTFGELPGGEERLLVNSGRLDCCHAHLSPSLLTTLAKRRRHCQSENGLRTTKPSPALPEWHWRRRLVKLEESTGFAGIFEKVV